MPSPRALVVAALLAGRGLGWSITPFLARHDAASSSEPAVLLSGRDSPAPDPPSPPAPPGEEAAAPALTPKYFHEPGGSLARGHYDERFFREEMGYDEHRRVLRQLIRSYLATAARHGFETWLAHGTLLGWWWNGRAMPWDYDLDVQVSDATLRWMAARLNRTEHEFNATDADADSPDADSSGPRRYLLDVNPHHADLTRGDGMNIIDARWIDTANGMFVDITGLRERDPARPGLWSCKNMHRYASRDLWPMRLTEFEGARARIPYNVDRILADEYGPQCLVTEEHAGHRWDRDIKEWVMMSPDEQQRRHHLVRERKRQQMIRDGRLPAP
ncbi:hypothetical protein CDD83_10497 [Cordyceps sp. RAO-2017]|nr:hypothetical protein CDD83_10497 [Cordyceps sp. RAO-2017]